MDTNRQYASVFTSTMDTYFWKWVLWEVPTSPLLKNNPISKKQVKSYGYGVPYGQCKPLPCVDFYGEIRLPWTFRWYAPKLCPKERGADIPAYFWGGHTGSYRDKQRQDTSHCTFMCCSVFPHVQSGIRQAQEKNKQVGFSATAAGKREDFFILSIKGGLIWPTWIANHKKNICKCALIGWLPDHRPNVKRNCLH